MSESTSPPQPVDSATIRQEWSSIVERITRQHARIVVEEDGKAIAAIVSVADLQHLKLLDEQRAHFLAVMDRTQAAFADVPDDELAEELEKAHAAARATPSGPTSGSGQ